MCMMERNKRKGDFFPHHSQVIGFLIAKKIECLFLILSLFRMSLVKVLRNNSIKYFSFTSYLINKNTKKIVLQLERNYNTHTLHALHKHIMSPANLKDYSSTTHNYFLLSYQKNSSSLL